MNKLREWIEIWLDGKEVRGITNVPPETRQELAEVYNGIVRKENPAFINAKIKEILDKCGIKTVAAGVGWRVADLN